MCTSAQMLSHVRTSSYSYSSPVLLFNVIRVLHSPNYTHLMNVTFSWDGACRCDLIVSIISIIHAKYTTLGNTVHTVCLICSWMIKQVNKSKQIMRDGLADVTVTVMDNRIDYFTGDYLRCYSRQYAVCSLLITTCIRTVTELNFPDNYWTVWVYMSK